MKLLGNNSTAEEKGLIMSKIRTVLCVALVVCIGFASVAMAEDAAMVVEVQSGQAMYDSGDKKGSEVALMDFLSPSDRIKLNKGTLLILNYFSSGAREEIQGPGVITVGENKSKADGATVKSDKVDYLPKTAMTEGGGEHMGAVVLRDAGGGSGAVLPIGLTETAVRSLPLKFQWIRVPGADSYALSITDSKGSGIVSEKIKATYFEVDDVKFEKGVEYSWTVEAFSGSDLIGEGGGSFYLLPDEQVQHVTVSEKYIQSTYPEDSMESRVALAMLYKKYQLNDEARVVLLELRKKQPQNLNIVKHLKDLKSNYKPGS